MVGKTASWKGQGLTMGAIVITRGGPVVRPQVVATLAAELSICFARFDSNPSVTAAGDAKRALVAEVTGIAKRLGVTLEEWDQALEEWDQAAHNVRVVAEGQS